MVQLEDELMSYDSQYEATRKLLWHTVLTKESELVDLIYKATTKEMKDLRVTFASNVDKGSVSGYQRADSHRSFHTPERQGSKKSFKQYSESGDMKSEEKSVEKMM